MNSEKNKIILYGNSWCIDSHRARIILDKQGIDYTNIDIESDKQAQQFVIKVNNGYQSVPTILFPDGSILVEPSNKALSEKLDSLNNISK